MMKTFVKILKTVGLAALIIWLLLTAIVLIFLFDKWIHPNLKSISKIDLVDYKNLSIWLLIIFTGSRLLTWFIPIKIKKG